MIGNKFYPIPKKLIDKMLEGIDLSMVSSILDPSAGKGNIVEILRKREEESYSRSNSDIDCIEIGLKRMRKQKRLFKRYLYS